MPKTPPAGFGHVRRVSQAALLRPRPAEVWPARTATRWRTVGSHFGASGGEQGLLVFVIGNEGEQLMDSVGCHSSIHMSSIRFWQACRECAWRLVAADTWSPSISQDDVCCSRSKKASMRPLKGGAHGARLLPCLCS